MKDVKSVVEDAHFSIPADTPYEGFLVVKKAFKKINRKTSEGMFFNSRDVLIDALIMEFRQKPEMNVWRKRLPLEIIDYCYKLVPHRRMSFVYDARDIAETQLDFLICIFDDRNVTKSPDYTQYYDSAIRRRAVR